MKKLLTMLLAILMVLSLFGCAKPADSTPTSASNAESTPSSDAAASTDTAPAASKYDEGDTIKVGMVAYLTGPQSNIGDIAMESATLAIDRINAAGGVLGKQLELVVEDAGENQQTNYVATSKILSDGEISCMYHTWASSDSISASPLVLEYKIPTIAAGSSMNVWKEENPYMWQIRMTDNYNAPVMAEVATQQLGMKNPAIIYLTDSFGEGYYNGIKDAFDAMGIEIATALAMNVDETNAAPIVAQVAASGCDGLIACTHDNEAVVLMKQVELAGLDIPCIGPGSYGTEYVTESAGADAADGWYSLSDWCVDLDTEVSKEFVTSFREKYPGLEPTMQDTYAYDAIYMFAKAIELAGSADPEAINNAMSQLEPYDGVLARFELDDHHVFGSSCLMLRNDGTTPVIESVVYRPKQ